MHVWANRQDEESCRKKKNIDRKTKKWSLNTKSDEKQREGERERKRERETHTHWFKQIA